MNKRKVLIVIGDVASGHRSAANALAYVFEKRYKKYDVEIVDLYKISDPFLDSNLSYKITTHKLIEPSYNYVFRISNYNYVFPIFKNLHLTTMYKKSEKFILNKNPDIVISNHPIVVQVVSEIKKRHPDSFCLAVVISDLINFFRGWADKRADLTSSPTKEATNKLIKFGVDKSKIIDPLFPINPNLKNKRAKSKVLKELGLERKKTTVLITGGGLGTSTLKRAINTAAKKANLQVIVITGKLAKFKKILSKKYSGWGNVAVLGYVSNMQDYLNASDIVIAKPGPATILEIELFGKQGIFTKYVGEQEKGNVKYLLKNPNFRYISDKVEKLEQTLDELLTQKPKKFCRRSFDESYEIIRKIISQYERVYTK